MSIKKYFGYLIFRSSFGMALPVIITALLIIGVIMLSLSRSSQSELNLLDKLISSQKLIYLVRTGFAIAETRLANERWYGDTKPRDVFVVPLDDPEASLKVYCDDYVQVVARRYDKIYRMLDHIKVFVEARYRGNVMYGFGKFILSPEPVFDGKSTIGVTGVRADQSVNTEPAPTLRRIIGMKFLHEEDLKAAVPTFAGMDDVESRKALGRFWAGDQIPYARLYGRNLTLSESLLKNSPEFPVSGNGVIDIEQCRRTLQSIDVPSNALANLENQNCSENVLKNTFIGETLKRFFLSTAWDVSSARREEELKKIEIYIPYLPIKCTNPDIIKAVGIAFGAPHPISVCDYIPTFTYDLTTNRPAAEIFLKTRGYNNSYPSVLPTQFCNDLAKIQTANGYSFSWKATLVLTGENPGTITESGNILSSSRFVFLHEHIGQPIEGDASYTITVESVQITSKEGPTPYYSDYYIRMPGTNRNYPLRDVLNFFLKYLDDSLVELPPPEKTNAYTNPASGTVAVVDPFIEGGSGYVVLF